MNKIRLLKLVNPVLFFSFLVQALTGIAMVHQKIVPGFISRHLIFKIHEYNGIILILLVVSHVYLNWGWVRMNILKKR